MGLLELLEFAVEIGVLILSLAAIIGAAAFPAVWILQPLVRAAGRRRHPAQFSLADFLCLAFLLQISMALIHWTLESDYTPARLVLFFDAFAWCGLGALWWSGVRTLSCAGVDKPWVRCIFLAVAIPVTAAATIALPMLIGLTPAALSQGPEELTLLIPTATVGLIALVYAMGRATRWTLRRYAVDADPSPAILADLPKGPDQTDG